MRKHILYAAGVVCLVALLLLPTGAGAKSSTSQQVKQLQRAVTALQKLSAKQDSRIKALQAQVTAKHALLTGSGAPATALGDPGDLYLNTTGFELYGPKTDDWGAPTSLIGPRGTAGAQGVAGTPGPDPRSAPELAGLFALAPYVTVSHAAMNGVKGPNIVFSGVNLHVVSGSGSTDDGSYDDSTQAFDPSRLTGLGNLIVGYDEVPEYTQLDRSGSNNLVVGTRNDFSAFGGIVGGDQNTSSAGWASTIGGFFNTASGVGAAVTGSSASTASGESSTVTAGSQNVADGPGSSISGGAQNVALGDGCSVSGGSQNAAGGSWSSVSGGHKNAATVYADSVTGGFENIASGGESCITGGFSNHVTTSDACISGGFYLTLDEVYGWAAGIPGFADDPSRVPAFRQAWFQAPLPSTP